MYKKGFTVFGRHILILQYNQIGVFFLPEHLRWESKVFKNSHNLYLDVHVCFILSGGRIETGIVKESGLLSGNRIVNGESERNRNR